MSIQQDINRLSPKARDRCIQAITEANGLVNLGVSRDIAMLRIIGDGLAGLRPSRKYRRLNGPVVVRKEQ